MFSDMANTLDVEEGQFTNSVDVGLEGEGIVKDNTQVPGQGSGINFSRANLDGSTRGGLKEFGVNGEELSLIIIELE